MSQTTPEQTAPPEPVPGHALKMDVNTGSRANPTWTPIGGVTANNPSQTSQMADATDFDDPGWEKSIVTQRGMSFSCPFNFKEDEDGEGDPGQEAVAALALAIGVSAIGEFRYHMGAAGKGVRFRGNVDLAFPSGTVTDISKQTCEIKMYGPPSLVSID